MTKPKKATKIRRGQSVSKARLADSSSVDEIRSNGLPKGFVIYIDGLPFRLETDAVISGHKKNFISAGLWKESRNVGG